jgi:hypothetical protein
MGHPAVGEKLRSIKRDGLSPCQAETAWGHGPLVEPKLAEYACSA